MYVKRLLPIIPCIEESNTPYNLCFFPLQWPEVDSRVVCTT